MKIIPLKNLQKCTNRKFAVIASAAGVKVVTFERNPKTNQITWYLEKSDLLDRVNKEFFLGTLCLPVNNIFHYLELYTSQTNHNYD